ncbi:MAG: glycosyltransferase, partial [Candidatus Lokiarchaeota archaeon]|nr:glycosyltransferase [Candidatus Lokiarchaeota archaeon]
DGLLAEFDNPIDIGDKVIKLLKNKRLRKQMGNQGKEKVMRNYTWNIIAKQTHETYNELVKNYVDKK